MKPYRISKNKQNKWIKGTKRENKTDGMRQNYLCKQYITAKCTSKCYLLFHNNNDCVSLYVGEHDHNNHEKLTDHGISPQFQDYIDAVYDIYPKLGQMKRHLNRCIQKIEKKILSNRSTTEELFKL